MEVYILCVFQTKIKYKINYQQDEIRKTFTEMLEDKEREQLRLQTELEQLQAEVEQLKLEAENEEVNRLQAQEPVR